MQRTKVQIVETWEARNGRGKEIILKNPVSLVVEYFEDGSVGIRDAEGLDMISIGESFEQAMSDIEAELYMLYNEYYMGDPSIMTYGALKLKKKLEFFFAH